LTDKAQEMSACLIVHLDQQIFREFPLDKKTASIGRQADNDIVIEDTYVSRYHARAYL
jgi:pSer/pThr/pTyr-binding forkhead associated (FHA) protein